MGGRAFCFGSGAFWVDRALVNQADAVRISVTGQEIDCEKPHCFRY
jgi:predicted amino acid dehydrogenase